MTLLKKVSVNLDEDCFVWHNKLNTMLFRRRRKSLWWDKRANIAFGSHKFPQLRFACVIYWFCGFILSCTDTQTWLQFSNKLFSPSNSRRCLHLERFSFIYVLPQQYVMLATFTSHDFDYFEDITQNHFLTQLWQILRPTWWFSPT